MSFALVQISPFQVLNFFVGGLPPDPVLWPDGSATHATAVGFARGNWMFCTTVTTPAQPGPLFTLSASTPSLAGSIVTYTQTWTPPALATAKLAYIQQINNAAETLLQSVSLIAGPGQAVVHQRKIAEATALASDVSPNPANYPLLSGLIGVQGSTINAVGTAVIASVSLWATTAAQIEAQRVNAVLGVSAATTLVGAVAVLAAVTWPTISSTASVGTGTVT